MLAAATQGQEQEQRMVQLLELAASVGKDTGGEVRLGAEQGGDVDVVSSRLCRVLWQTQAIAVQGGTTVLGKVRSLNDVG